MSEDKANMSIAAMPDAVPIGRLLALHAACDPGRTALIIGDERISFAELDARSPRRARMLAADGVRQGDFVPLALPNGSEIYETSFALRKLGAVPNVVSSRLPDARAGSTYHIWGPRRSVRSTAFTATTTRSIPSQTAGMTFGHFVPGPTVPPVSKASKRAAPWMLKRVQHDGGAGLWKRVLNRHKVDELFGTTRSCNSKWGLKLHFNQ